MADKAISELIAAEQIKSTDLFVLEQDGTAKRLQGQTLLNWLTAAADGHGGISGIEKTGTSGLVDTYRITLADTTVYTFTVTNGNGITGFSKIGTSGLADTYRFTLADGTYADFTVTNGAKGDKGDNSYVWIKYASQQPTADSHSMGDEPDDWIGIYAGTASSAPTDWQQYSWYQIKGEKGDTGSPATLTSSVVEYMASDSGTIVPSGSWSTSIPTVAQGKYLWTRITNTFNTGSPVVAYAVSRMGLDGSGAVSSVNGLAPDAEGNVSLSADKITTSDGGSVQDALDGAVRFDVAQALSDSQKSQARSNIGAPDSDDVQAKITAGGILKGDGAGGVSAAVKGTDYAGPSVGVTATLTAAGWDAVAKTQTVSVSGVTATANCIITAAPDSYMAYAEAGVRCTAQGAGTLTFACETVPTADVASNVLILG